MSLKFSTFEDYPALVYGISEKSDGSMRLLTDERVLGPIYKNRRKYFSKLSIPLSKIVQGWLVHGHNIHITSDSESGNIIPETDALITDSPNIFLAVTNADCFPVYFFDPEHKAVGIAHAGWKGVVENIVGKTVRRLKKNFKSNEKKILAGIGPGIRECHFEILKENLKYYKNYPEYVIKKDKKVFINLAGIIRKRLLKEGVRKENLEDCNLCTHCLKNKYFSYRRDKPEIIEAMIAYIGLKFDKV